LGHNGSRQKLDLHFDPGRVLEGACFKRVLTDEPKVVNGTWYHQETPGPVIQALESLRAARAQRCPLWLGDTATGKAWNEEWDVFETLTKANRWIAFMRGERMNK